MDRIGSLSGSRFGCVASCRLAAAGRTNPKADSQNREVYPCAYDIALGDFIGRPNHCVNTDSRKAEQNKASDGCTARPWLCQAQKVAADLNKKQVESIKSQYAAIAEKSEIDYEKRLADNRRSLALWLRSKGSPSQAGSTGAGSPATVSGEPVQDPTEAVVPVSDLEIAADNYSQLISLIEWAKSVGAVKPIE